MSATSKRAEANRANAARSTGPQTANGKARASANAVRHGMLSAAPVVAGESAAGWQTHRSGILESLGPVGLLELRLAERVASLLWRLGRVERFEAGTVGAALLEAQGDGRQGDDTPVQRLAQQRRHLARFEAVVQTLRGLSQLADDAPVAGGVAFNAVEAAYWQVGENDGLEMFDTPEFLARVGIGGDTNFSEASWTGALLRRALGVIAEHHGVPLTRLAGRAARDAERERDKIRGRVDELAAEVRAGQRRERAAAGKKRSAALLPDDAAEAKVIRYEAHMSRQMYQALHELERVQARRAGRNVPLPIAADVGVNLTVAGDPAE
jgi:hypothetical protein